MDSRPGSSQKALEYLSHADPEMVTQTLCAIVLKNTNIEPDRLQPALVAWREQFYAGGTRMLWDLLQERGLLNTKQVKTLVKAVEYTLKRREDKLFGRRAQRKGLISNTQLSEALAFQKHTYRALRQIKRLEDILGEEGKLKPNDVSAIWAEFHEAKAKSRSPKPANVARAAKSAGLTPLAQPVGEIQKLVLPPTAPKPESKAEKLDKAAAPTKSASALDLDSLKLEPLGKSGNPADKTKAKDQHHTDDPAAVLADVLPPAPKMDDKFKGKLSMQEEKEAERQRKSDLDRARLKTAPGATPVEEDDFSDDNMKAALNEAVEELDLSEDFTPRQNKDASSLNLDELLDDDDDAPEKK